jgi:hypothetical protein
MFDSMTTRNPTAPSDQHWRGTLHAREKYPGWVRIGIVILGSILSWALVGLAVWSVLG